MRSPDVDRAIELLKKEIMAALIPQQKYKFSREWWVAEYDWTHHDEVIEWCTEQFGPRPQRPDAWCRWYNKYIEKIHFRDQEDYVLFVLRWA